MIIGIENNNLNRKIIHIPMNNNRITILNYNPVFLFDKRVSHHYSRVVKLDQKRRIKIISEFYCGVFPWACPTCKKKN
jgi:hypothetical protein